MKTLGIILRKLKTVWFMSTTILLDIFKKLQFLSSPTANFSLLFMLLVSALPPGAKWNQSFAVGENKNVQ
jgi:hypothetical protein